MTQAVGPSRHDTSGNGHRSLTAEPAPPAVTTASSAVVSLRRLLGLATLTPPQAGHVALEALTSGADGRFGTEYVLIDAEGTVRLAAGEDDVAPAGTAAALLRELAHNADRPAARRRPANAALLITLEHSADLLAAGDAEPAVAELRRALAATGADPNRLAAELAALVSVPLVRVGAQPERVTDVTGTVVAAIVEPAPNAAPIVTPLVNGARNAGPNRGAPPPTLEPLPTAAPAPASPRSRIGSTPRRKLIVIATAAALAVAAVLIAVGLTRPAGKPAAAAVRTPHVATSPTAARPSHTAVPGGPRAVPTLAAAAAGPVSRVGLHPLHDCAAGTTCSANVRIYLRSPWLTGLTWHAVAVDRCTGSMRTIDHGAMIAEPGWRSAYATVSLPLPHASSLAVIAVVDTPVSAASKPLLVPTGGGHCAQS